MKVNDILKQLYAFLKMQKQIKFFFPLLICFVIISCEDKIQYAKIDSKLINPSRLVLLVFYF